jgi:hypothetical protein
MEEDGREQPANDNHSPDNQDAGAEGEVDTYRRLDVVVLTIARLIGRKMAREDYEKALRAANDHAPSVRDEVRPEADDED